VSENLSDVNDAERHKTAYEYNERDLLWKVTDANGGVRNTVMIKTGIWLK